MNRTGTIRRLGAAILALGVIATFSDAQQRQASDPLAEARARQAIADQKAEAEVLSAIQEADRTARTNPVKATRALKTAQINIDLSAAISTKARQDLTERIQRKIAALEGRPLPAAALKPDPNAKSVKLDRRVANESYAAEVKAVDDGIRRIVRYHEAGLTREADREIAALAKAYPNNPAVIVLQEKDSFASRAVASASFAKVQGDRIIASNNDLMASSLPAGGRDIEFPKDFKDRTAHRLKTVKLSAKEKKIIEALDKPMSVDWNNKNFEEALQELSTMMDQNLFLDKKSLSDLDITLNKPATLRANGVSTRTVLRQLLAAQGLTFVVKDEAIQVVTVERARDMLVTRVYYLGDLIQGVGPFGGAPQWGTFLDFQQTMANADVLIKSIQSSIDPLSWKDNHGAGTITFHVPSMSIIVRASAEVHASLGSKMGPGR